MDDVLHLSGTRWGKCIIQRPLAKGGYGYSYVAYDPELDKLRVIKISVVKNPETDAELRDIENFRQEGKILSRLNHPQIVPLIEQGEQNGYRYMIIDYIDGFDLRHVLGVLRKKQYEYDHPWEKIMDPPTALALILSGLGPISYTHTVRISLKNNEIVEGLAHRDISSGNFILGSGHAFEGRLHLIDFGTARTNMDDSGTVDMGVIGSVRYMSPMRLMKHEMKMGQDPYWRTFRQTQHDVHAMGCLLWELLTGESHIQVNKLSIGEAISVIQDPGTYTRLYGKSSRFTKGIREIIRRSVVYPDVRSESTPQYRTAGEMMNDVQHVYNDISGNAPVHEVLAQLASEISEPSRIQIVIGGKTTRVSQFSRSGRVKTGMAAGERSSMAMKILLAFSLMLIGVGGIHLYLAGRSESASREAFVPAGPPSEWEPVSAPVTPSRVSRQAPVPKPAPAESPAAAAPAEPALPAVPEATGPRDPAYDAGKTGPKVAELANQTDSASESPLQKEFGELKNLIRNNRIDDAYGMLKKMQRLYQDPALYIIQADLIHRKFPQSEKISALLEKARGRRSELMSEEDMERKIGALSR